MSEEVRPPGEKMVLAGWIVTGLVGAFLAFSASLKFFMPDVVRETMGGLGWPAHHDLMIGIIEVGCVALYLIPRTAVLGAVLETALLGGAIATNVRVDNPLFSHELFGVYLGVLVWLGLWLRDPRIRALLPLRR
jgi:DoxX-like family